MVHQHFMLIPVFTVTENVMLGEETVKAGGFLDRPKTAARINEISQKYSLAVDPNAFVKDIPVGVQQRVEIIKLLYRNAEILIFDEPTAVLTPQEADELFTIMRNLSKQGKSIIFITHKLREVMEIADRIVVIRRGKVVGSTTPEKADRNGLASMMVGRAVQLEVEKKKSAPKDVILAVKNLIVTDSLNQVMVDNVSFTVRAGEILGVAGVQGNGQTELAESVAGLREPSAGQILLMGNDVTHKTPREITELGSAHVPEDRQKDGLVLTFPVSDNLVLCTYYKKPFAKGITLEQDVILENANRLIEQFDIRTPNASVNVGALSGGNQQKVIIARELSRDIKFLIASQPTRGLDVGSIEYIHHRIVEKRDEGCAVLLISPELDEIMELSDKIAVMYRGKIVAILPADQTTKEQIGLLMAGITPETITTPVGSQKIETTF
jgi:simple sugar transport system ATP-binding protein